MVKWKAEEAGLFVEGAGAKEVQRGIEVRRVACVLAKAYELAHQERCGVK
jgi:hypothetical protein